MILDNFSKKDIDFLFKGFSISSLMYNFLIETIIKLEIDIEMLEKCTHYKLVPVRDGERISFIKAYKLWRAIESISNRSDIGILIADNFTISKAGIVGELFLHSKNLKESVVIIQRFLSLLIDNISIRYEEVEDNAIFYFDIVPRFIMPFSIIECYAKICYNWVKEYNNISNLSINEIGYYGTKPKNLHYYELNFPKVKVSFKHPENFIIIKKEIFYKDNMHKTSKLHYSYLLKYAENIKIDLSNTLTIKQKIINEILIEMPERQCSIEHVANNLKMSISSVKRKLKQENTGFKKLVELIRQELSDSMIQNSSMSYEEISYLLGYSEYSPFFRAFKKWHHCSPSVYKENFVSLQKEV